jgi:hypothetical protein
MKRHEKTGTRPVDDAAPDQNRARRTAVMQ